MESLISSLLAWVSSLSSHPVALFAALSVLGFTNVFFPPVPIEALAMAGGVFAGTGHGSPLVVWLGAAFGMSAGSILLYLLVASRGYALLEHAFIARQLPAGGLDKLHAWSERFGVWSLFLGKMIPGFSFATVLLAGLARLGKRKALPAITAANFLFFGLLVFGGRAIGRYLPHLSQFDLPDTWVTILSLAVLLAAGWFLLRRRQAVQPGVDAPQPPPAEPRNKD